MAVRLSQMLSDLRQRARYFFCLAARHTVRRRARRAADQLPLRRYADDVLFVSLQDQDSGNQSVSIPRSRVFWAGAPLGRYWEHSKPKLVGVLALLLAATAALYAIPVLVQVALDRWWLTILVWLAAIALAQIVAAATTSTRLVFMLLVGAAVVVPVVTIALLTVATTLTLNLLPWAVLKVLPGIGLAPRPQARPVDRRAGIQAGAAPLVRRHAPSPAVAACAAGREGVSPAVRRPGRARRRTAPPARGRPPHRRAGRSGRGRRPPSHPAGQRRGGSPWPPALR